ncbi:MAG: ribosomal protein S18-alanine N-acetyltransferase [Nitrospiraceae bacterium]|nr:ribosomal protein S18-alanine N-acetyltransferase [Nitrospiraceae bacterium]
MKMKFTLREMTEADLPQVIEIENLSFSTPWSAESFKTEISSSSSIAKTAVSENYNVIGYICAKKILDEAHILNIAVHKNFREKGIARKLIQSVLDELRENECRILYLEVRASNNIARKLYESFGAEVIGLRKQYYTHPAEDAVLMKLKL